MTGENNTRLLLAGFATILLGMAGLMVMFFFHTATMMKFNTINEELMEKDFAAYRMREAAEKRTFSLFRVIAMDDYFARDQVRLEMDRFALDFFIAQNRIDRSLLSEPERGAFEDILKSVAEARPVVDDAMARAVEDQWSPQVQQKIEYALSKFDMVHKALNHFVVTVEAETARRRSSISENRISEIRIISILGVFLFVLSSWVGTHVVRREISQTKRLEQRVKDSTGELSARELHYRTIFETAADGIITTDQYGRIESFNAAAGKMFGLSPSEALGKSVNILMPSHDAAHHDGYMSNYLGGGKPKIIGVGRQLVGVRKSGEEFPMWLAISRMDVKGVTKFVGVISDLSAQVTAEQEARLLADDNEIVAAILRLSMTSNDLDEIMQIALELILSRKNLDLQGKGSVFLRDAKSDVLDMHAQMNLSDELRVRCAQIKLGECLCGKAAERMDAVEKSCIDHDHSHRFDGMAEHGHFCVPINHGNENLGVLNLYIPAGHQVTVHERRLIWAVADALAGVIRRHRNEDDLRHALRRAEAANQTKTEFLANMSHELRTPLNAIIGYSEMIETEVFGPVGTQKYKEYLNHISGSGRHLYDLINDILDVSRIETDEFPLDEEIINTRALIEECLATVQTRAQEAGNTVQFEAPDALPSLNVDRRRLKQVLLNLLNNAVKFTEPGGTITVRVDVGGDSGFKLCVVDTGIGIAAEDIEKVFDMFGQVDSSLSRKYDGAGLGLPLSRKLIEKHGGQLTLESRVGEGTTAILVLPRERVVWN